MRVQEPIFNDDSDEDVLGRTIITQGDGVGLSLAGCLGRSTPTAG
jgi:hypothetical protein